MLWLQNESLYLKSLFSYPETLTVWHVFLNEQLYNFYLLFKLL